MKKKYVMALVIAGIVLVTGCPGTKDTEFGDRFPIPPRVLTLAGEDPVHAYTTPPVADIYWSNTKSERGYVQNGKDRWTDPSPAFYHFFTAITKSPAINYVPAYYTLKENAGGFLKWTQVERLDPEKADFYFNGGYLEHDEGPLTMMYKNDLINPEHLTIVVTDLEEQGINGTLLADLIRSRLIKTPDYAAALIAVKLPFNGMNYKPSIDEFHGMPGKLYNGEKPLYAIVSGPKDGVGLFLRRFAAAMEKNDDRWYTVTTSQRGKIGAISFQDISIPPSASKADFSRVDRNNTRILDHIWDIRTGRENQETNEPYEGVPDRIWNLKDETAGMVDHFGIPDGGVLKPIQFESPDDVLALELLRYKKTGTGTKNGHGLWQLALDFTITGDYTLSELEIELVNYRYLVWPEPVGLPEDAGETDAKRKKKKKELDKPKVLPVWQQNDGFIKRDFEVGQPAFLPDSNKVQCYVAPMDKKQGTLESSVVCFDVVVRIKQEVVIPDWVSEFDDPDSSGVNQDRTWNLGVFVDNLLKGDSLSGTAFITDELIKIPVVMYDMPTKK